METEAPATSASNGTGAESSKKQQMTEIAMNLLAQGRRHLLVTDIPSAIAALAESTQILAELYGEQADECAESYYYYGMALLEAARTDSDVLGDAVEGNKGEEDGSSDDDEENGEEDGEESEDGDEDGEKDQEEGEKKEVNGKAKVNGAGEGSAGKAAEESKTNGEAKADAEGTSSDKPEDIEMKEEAKPTADSKPAEEAKNGESPKPSADSKPAEEEKNGGSPKPKKESKGKALKAPGSSAEASASEATADDNGDAEDTGDDVTNLQLAWEVFELAKNIFQRKAETDPSAKPRLADSLVRLAEVAIESENYVSAIEDLQKCLDIQKASFPADSRSLAETYYQLGVAYTFTTEFSEAVKSFEAAAEVIKLRIENLKNPAEKKPSMEEPRNMFHTIEGEIEELEALLPDIKEKIADTIDLEKEALRKLTENGTGSSTSTSNGAGTSADGEAAASSATTGDSPSKPATDITHLIRKKRKPEEVEAEASAAKKVCTDPAAADPVAASS